MGDAIFRYQLYKRKPSDRQHALVEGDLRKLAELADRMEADYGAKIAPGNPAKIRALVADIRSEFGESKKAAPPETPPLLRDIQVTSVDRTSAVISWASDAAGDTRVEYGATLPRYGAKVSGRAPASRRHRVTLTGLKPGTRYYFRVKTKTAASPARTGGRELVSGDFRFKTGKAPRLTKRSEPDGRSEPAGRSEPDGRSSG